MKTFLFVYNARSGSLHKGIDFFHKIISPDTYTCNLCKITHGIFAERSKWKTFRKLENVEMKFYYKDEFEAKFGKKLNYPVVLDSRSLNILLSDTEINRLTTLDELIEIVRTKANVK
ncbi:MAG: hypothetical protein RIA62_14170 [Cyclobacteriaceae bacterium]|tara:strand:- start:1585 stop:1935 length:351 start_codon:yes stop_codon:yes gene_type:complete